MSANDRERRLVLREGQVYVSVKSDPGRDFVVQAREGTVRALGTAFNVRMDDRRCVLPLPTMQYGFRWVPAAWSI